MASMDLPDAYQKPPFSGILFVRWVFGTGWVDVMFDTVGPRAYGRKGTYFWTIGRAIELYA